MRPIGAPPTQRVVVVAQEQGAISRVEAAQLLGAHNTLMIAHGSEHYVLRLTRKGKLILTK